MKHPRAIEFDFTNLLALLVFITTKRFHLVTNFQSLGRHELCSVDEFFLKRI